MRNKIIVGLVAIAAIAGISMYALAPKQESIEYRLGPAQMGDIESLVVSTGTLEALNTVIVGSQLSGQIDELRADFNDVVEEGQIIARIDPRTFEARKKQNAADVEVAGANIVSRRAELTRATATLRQAQRELARRHSLKERGHVSESELDADITAVETAAALVQVAKASVTNAEAVLAQREAALAQSELDLERTFIRSPVDGTVINRTIELGQTVAASFSAPELFAIGQDLHQMKVEASIDEADIGRVSEGMQCRFTVDAYPERRFTGRIRQIRKAPNVLQNVVTYKVIITANNADLALLPGMTANVEIVLGRKDEVLRIPNGALRFAPRNAGDAPCSVRACFRPAGPRRRLRPSSGRFFRARGRSRAAPVPRSLGSGTARPHRGTGRRPRRHRIRTARANARRVLRRQRRPRRHAGADAGHARADSGSHRRNPHRRRRTRSSRNCAPAAPANAGPRCMCSARMATRNRAESSRALPMTNTRKWCRDLKTASKWSCAPSARGHELQPHPPNPNAQSSPAATSSRPTPWARKRLKPCAASPWPSPPASSSP